MTPTAPRWRSSTEDIERLKRKKAHFFAKGHTLIDAYEAHLPRPTNEKTEAGQDSDSAPMTYEECLEAIAELEKEFGMEFPFRPEPLKEVEEEPLVADAPPF